MINTENYHKIIEELKPYHASLVAVSKTKPAEDILLLKETGQLTFGENYVQELIEKHNVITGVEWHFIGHLQSNKAKMIVPFISLIQSVDSLNLLSEINKQSEKLKRVTDCLLQIHIAEEESKFGLSFAEAEQLLNDSRISQMKNISLKGLMGMATLTNDQEKIRKEFKSLKKFYDKEKNNGFSILSMGMTGDYKIALEEGSTLVRIGSAIFGERNL